MRPAVAVFCVLVAVALPVACVTPDVSSASPATASEVGEEAAIAVDVSRHVGRYGASIAEGTWRAADCAGREQAYEDGVRPLVVTLGAHGGGIDTLIAAHHGALATDVGCAADALMAELDRHRAVGCDAWDPVAARAEGARHVAVMTRLLTHVTQRCDAALRGLTQGVWRWDPMLEGCESVSDPGGMMPGGGM